MQAATGYALRGLHSAFNTTARRSPNQLSPYTYPQPTPQKSASTPGSIFSRHGGSNLDRRRHFSPQKRLGSNLSRLSQIQDGKWKVVSDYVTP